MSRLFPMHSTVSGDFLFANTHCPVIHALDTVVIPACLCLIAIVFWFVARLRRNSFCLGNRMNGVSFLSSALYVDR